MLKRLLLALISVSLFAAPSLTFAGSPKEITVSAAISLKNAFEEIGKLYEREHGGTKVLFNFGASGDLVQQIAGGAPVDVFASAAEKDMNDLSAKGFVMPGTRVDFVKNHVVLVTPANAAAVRTFEDLASGSVKRIAAGNPKTVPAGRYAAEVFNYYKIASAISSKLIYAENVRQVLDYVARGEVDAGVVYSTDAAVRGAEVHIAAVAPDASHKPVIYPIAVVKGTGNEAAARAFVEEVRSGEGKAVLKKYGFSIP